MPVQVSGSGGQAEWIELMTTAQRSVHTQKYLLSLCWITTLPASHAADGFAILLHEVSPGQRKHLARYFSL